MRKLVNVYPSIVWLQPPPSINFTEEVHSHAYLRLKEVLGSNHDISKHVV